jgi:hypothetical protein
MTAELKQLQSDLAKLRSLLALWYLGAAQQEVKKSLLTKRIVSKGQKIADYKELFEDLEQQGAIVLSRTGYTLVSPKGLEVLGETLRNSELQLEGSVVGTWVANALLRWISQTVVGVVKSSVVDDGVESQVIASYEEFKPVALEVYDKLNYEYNFNHLVPIYRLRRAIGQRVSRTEFNDWLLEMQADDILQLQGGSVEDSARDKIEDSITTELSGIRCYCRRIKP